MPTQEHRPLILAEPPNLMAFTRFAITACPQSTQLGAAVCGRWPQSKVTNWCSLCPHRSHTSTMMKVNPTVREGTPSSCTPSCVRFSAGGASKNSGFIPQSLFYVSGDFHTFGPFSERVVIFSSKWNHL